MIAQLSPGHVRDDVVVRHHTKVPALGTVCRMHWRMLCKNSTLPHTFYSIGSSGLCRVSGKRALLLGRAENAEEFGDFLRFCNILQLTSNHQPPDGWQVVETTRVMLRAPATQAALPARVALNSGESFCKSVSPSSVLALLESGDGPIPPLARDFFYADLCARRNHGYTAMYGITKNNTLLAGAGIWALLEKDAYIANVETHALHRHRGLATTLLTSLCCDFGKTRTLSLLCEEPLISFYTRFGFQADYQHFFVSVRP